MKNNCKTINLLALVIKESEEVVDLVVDEGSTHMNSRFARSKKEDGGRTKKGEVRIRFWWNKFD